MTQPAPRTTIGADRVNHVGRVVTDLGRSLAPFHDILTGAEATPEDRGGGPRMTGVLGLEAGEGFKAGAGTTVACFDDPDGTHLELIQPKGPFRRRADGDAR